LEFIVGVWSALILIVLYFLLESKDFIISIFLFFKFFFILTGYNPALLFPLLDKTAAGGMLISPADYIESSSG
tara:strand:+ start:345 stop:563 length:219 start_codon:yes stop_codon:yes gene_type:complete